MTPLVFLHGFTGSPTDLDEVLRLAGIAPGEHAREPAQRIAPWLLGHGPSVAPMSASANSAAPAHGSETFVAEVERLASELAATLRAPAHLVGYSLGGRLALGLLLAHPELFRSATLLSTHPGLETAAEREQRQRSDELWCALLLSSGLEAFVDAWQAQALFETQARLDPAILAAQRQRRLAHSALGLVASLRQTGLGQMPPYLERLASLKHPVTLMVGAEDSKFALLAKQMLARLPRATLEIVPRSGHNLLLEQPSSVARSLELE